MELHFYLDPLLYWNQHFLNRTVRSGERKPNRTVLFTGYFFLANCLFLPIPGQFDLKDPVYYGSIEGQAAVLSVRPQKGVELQCLVEESLTDRI